MSLAMLHRARGWEVACHAVTVILSDPVSKLERRAPRSLLKAYRRFIQFLSRLFEQGCTRREQPIVSFFRGQIAVNAFDHGLHDVLEYALC